MVAQILCHVLEYPAASTEAKAEVERLSALIDGLTVDMLTVDSGMSHSECRLILPQHVGQLAEGGSAV